MTRDEVEEGRVRPRAPVSLRTLEDWDKEQRSESLLTAEPASAVGFVLKCRLKTSTLPVPVSFFPPLALASERRGRVVQKLQITKALPGFFSKSKCAASHLAVLNDSFLPTRRISGENSSQLIIRAPYCICG